MPSFEFKPQLYPIPFSAPISFDGVLVKPGVNTMTPEDYQVLSTHKDFSDYAMCFVDVEEDIEAEPTKPAAKATTKHTAKAD